MDILQDELAKLHRDGNLNQSIQDVDKIIEQLERARESIVAGMRYSLLHSRNGDGCREVGRQFLWTADDSEMRPH
jgi:hypothetical protein